MEQHEKNGALSEYDIRVQKVNEIRDHKVNPWPSPKNVTASCQEIYTQFEDGQEKEYCIAGRLMAIREHGKTVFATLQDESGRLQVYLKADIMGAEQFELFKKSIDSGDIIWCRGTVFRTKMGEITLKVEEFALLSKCLHGLPDKFHGIADIEIKYRQRYLDLMVDLETRSRFKKRFLVVQEMRTFLQQNSFMEVETPMLHPIPGGALARPFITHHNTLNADLYLRIAPELYLKRLVVGGFERVFEINRNFRNEGISTKHNPEFTMIELYVAYKDYEYMMDLVEQMLRTIAQNVCGKMILPFADQQIDFGSPFKRLSMIDAVAQQLGCQVSDLQENTIHATAKKHGVILKASQNTWGYTLNALFEQFVESHLIQPTFITCFPVDVSPLAKRSEKNSLITDRFELYIAGMELSNGFNELNDPFDQAKRFKEQALAHGNGDVEAHRYDDDFITALEYGMPPTVGAGIGIDRLVMLLTNSTSIKEVILFPTLKQKQKS